MTETENLLKIQEFIDDHKDDVSEGEYLLMVNTLMNVWKNGNGQQTKNEKLIQELQEEIFRVEDWYFNERRLHNNTRSRHHKLSKKNDSLMKQIVQQNKQIQMLESSIQNWGIFPSEIQSENSTIGRCEYLFTKGKFKNELCGACCDPGKNRCNRH